VEQFPLGALLRDPRSPDSLDIRVLSCDEEHLVVSFGSADRRRYKRREALLRRWQLAPRTAVAILPESKGEEVRKGVVVALHGSPDATQPWSYLVLGEGGSAVVCEQRLRVLKIETEDPVIRLEMNGWRGPKRFYARLGLLGRTTVWKRDSEGIPAFLGARIEPLFHQFSAARRCLLDREMRFLLADEVGLGKTIEAGLVIQSLLAAKPSLRVLVVTPGTTSRQWLSELYSRFGGRVFTHIDAVRYDSGSESHMALDTLLRSDRLIITTSLLRTRRKALDTVTEQAWDLLVVDEGHHLANWPDLATALRRVSSTALGCLVLTATPGRGDEKGLLELLKLVAPSTYDHVTESEFAARLEPQRRITEKLLYSEELLAALLAQGEVGESDAKELAEQWRDLFPGDPIVVERLARMERGDGEAAEELVAHIQENYRVDRRIIRTRRRTLGEYGTHHTARKLESVEYEPSPPEVEVVQQVDALVSRVDVPPTWKSFWARHVCTTPKLLQTLLNTRLSVVSGVGVASAGPDPLAADLGPSEEEAALKTYLSDGQTFPGEKVWLEGALSQVERWRLVEPQFCARFTALSHWLATVVGAGDSKTLVFSQSRMVIEELAACLRAKFGADAIAVMTHNLGDDEISEVSRRFERHSKCRVLLSDEVGAEGRNFQFADAVVHMDQPFIVARLEQRIGRLDRIGRALDRSVLSVSISGPSDIESAMLEFHRDVFRVYERSIGGLEYLLPRLQQQIRDASSRGARALRRLAGEMRQTLEAEEQQIDEAFSFFLDATRPELERAKELSELVADRTGDEDESFVRDWCKELRIDLIPQEADCLRVEVRTERLDAPLKSLGTGDWVRTGTFLRSTALDNSAVHYFAPGHVFVDALLQSAQNAHDARATVFVRDLGTQAKGRIFAVVVGRLGPDEAAWQGSVLPGLMRRAEHYLPVEWVRSAWEIHPDGDVTPVHSGTLLERLCRDLQVTDRKCYPENMPGIVERYPGLWTGVRDAVQGSRGAILAHKKDELDAAADELADALRSELAYLRSRGQESVDAAQALREREALLRSVRNAAVVTDAVAIVVGGETR
jgi:ATP-dependent helicase HepA